jgi:hypothetical protein
MSNINRITPYFREPCRNINELNFYSVMNTRVDAYMRVQSFRPRRRIFQLSSFL